MASNKESLKVSNLPINADSWKAVLNKVKEVHPNGEKIVELVRKFEGEEFPNSDDFKDIEVKIPPVTGELNLTKNVSPLQKIDQIQKYLNQLQYNHTGTQFFEIKMSRSINRLYEVAKDIMKYSLPIKCLEAVILSLYLTAGIKEVSRFTIRFKSKFNDSTHKHIVLGLYYNSNYGTVGLSRRKTLMDKPVVYKNLTDLIFEFRNCYKECFHDLVKVKLSTFITTDIHSCDHVEWNHFSLKLLKYNDQDIRSFLEKYSREMKRRTCKT